MTDSCNRIRQKAMIQLAKIEAATSPMEAVKAECIAESLVLGLEALDELSILDINNMIVVFQAALERRLGELKALRD